MKVNIGKYGKYTGRKISVKIDDSDVWNLDSTLAYIILPCLLLLKERKHGVPNEFAEVGGASYDAQSCFDFYSETHNDAFNEGIKRWEEVLDKMIWSFQQLIIDYNDSYFYGKFNSEFVESDKTEINPVTNKVEKLYEMVDKNPNGHWLDTEGLALHEQRIQEGLELFGKYYRSLWD